MSKKRTDIKKEDKWNIEYLFKNDDLWEKELESLQKDVLNIVQFKGRLEESPIIIKEMIEKMITLDRRIDNLYTYAHMRHDEDTRKEKFKKFHDLAYNLYVEYSQLTSWIEPEIISIKNEIMERFINSSELFPYQFWLVKILRTKKHTLNENEEKLLSMVSNALTTPEDCFRSLNDSDIKFGHIINKDKKKLELTHSLYHTYLISKNRDVRKKAFMQYHNKFNEFPMTMASLLYGKVKGHIFFAKARNFESSLEASLFYKNIDTSVYTRLINTVKNRISSLHKYLDYRKQKMNLKELNLYDLYVPFVNFPEIKMTYDQAVESVIKSVKPLGDEYVSILSDGLKLNRWVDKYENENKRSGAYSTGCYDTMPYILMNYNGTLNAARTLSHEAGHSMHSYFTHKYQPPIYGNYPIFLAEVASTFNEELFNNYLINNTTDKKQKAYLINSRLEEIRATLFKQVMFAEFELLIHKYVENNNPLTYQLLNKEYYNLNKFYFGSAVNINKEIEIEWARIPHFYYNFYVYQYATGISAAISLYKRVINGSEKERIDYINFLKAGSSKFPLDILKEAGVDMTTTRAIEDTVDYFDELFEQLKKLEK